MADLEDLDQEGYLALYDAVDGFKPEKGYKFLTYAGYWIAQRMQRYIARQKRPESGIISLDSPINAEEGINTLMDTLQSDLDVETDVLEDIQRKQLKEVLWPLVDALPEEQAHVLRQRYKEGKTLKAIGESLGVNTDRARTIEGKALRSLEYVHVRLLRSFLTDEEAYSRGLVGNGVARFNTTWTSSTERAVMRALE